MTMREILRYFILWNGAIQRLNRLPAALGYTLVIRDSPVSHEIKLDGTSPRYKPRDPAQGNFVHWHPSSGVYYKAVES